MLKNEKINLEIAKKFLWIASRECTTEKNCFSLHEILEKDF